MVFRAFWDDFANACIRFYHVSVVMRPGFMLALHLLRDKFSLLSKLVDEPLPLIHSFRDNDQDPSLTIPYFLDHLHTLEKHLAVEEERNLSQQFRFDLTILVVDYYHE